LNHYLEDYKAARILKARQTRFGGLLVSEGEWNTPPKTIWPLISANITQNKRPNDRWRVNSAKSKEKYPATLLKIKNNRQTS
jgi:hypothetical protein